MENISKPIIVPWDFTSVAENAYAYAVNISRQLSRDIILLHIVAHEKDINPSLQKLENKSKELAISSGITTTPLIKAGNIFDTIRAVAHEHKAEMVVMGTHGRKGMQKLTGSWALKVLANSKVPFLVVQNKPTKDKIRKILFPIDFRSETKEKVNWIYYLSEHFNSTFVLLKRKSSDRGFRRKIASNLHYAENFLKNNDIGYEIHTASGKKSFEKETVDFAKEVGADMILVLVTRDIGFFDYIIAAKEQYIISNPESIPVLCLNPKPAKIASGFRASGG